MSRPFACSTKGGPQRRREDSVGGNEIGPSARLGEYARAHVRLRAGRREVKAEETGTRIGALSEPASRVPRHVNWLPRETFVLPADRFARFEDSPDANLVDIVEAAAHDISPDGISVVRPIGSVAYARAQGDLAWSLVRDLDVWVYVSSSIDAESPPSVMHDRLQAAVHARLLDSGMMADLSKRTGAVYLRDRNRRRRLVEPKLADLTWLADGVRHTWKRNRTLSRVARRPFAVDPHVEWAAYAPHENHYPSGAAQEVFSQVVRSLPAAEARRGLVSHYLENLALVMRLLGPGRLAEAIMDGGRFHRIARNALKKTLVLTVIRRDEHLRQEVLSQARAVHAGALVHGSSRARAVYLADLVDLVTSLRVVDAGVLDAWVSGGTADWARGGQISETSRAAIRA